MSGKGEVGKSIVSVNIKRHLQKKVTKELRNQYQWLLILEFAISFIKNFNEK